jgi:hypothetical protein
MPSKSQVKAYFAVRRLHGKDIANEYYPNVMWYLWEKWVDYKWGRIWTKQEAAR